MGVMRMNVSSIHRHCAFVLRTENVEDSPLSIQHSQSAGGVRRLSVEREGSHSSKDGNPLVDGRLTMRRMRQVSIQSIGLLSAWRSGSGSHLFVSEYQLPRDAGGFNEPNKTVNKFYLHGTNSVLEGLRHCCPPDHISHIT